MFLVSMRFEDDLLWHLLSSNLSLSSKQVFASLEKAIVLNKEVASTSMFSKLSQPTT